MDIEEYRKNVKRKTCNTKELGEILETSESKARRLTHIQDFPVICIGRDRRVILSKLDEWLEKHIGDCL